MKFQLRIYKLVLRPVLEESLYLWNALEYVQLSESAYRHDRILTCTSLHVLL